MATNLAIDDQLLREALESSGLKTTGADAKSGAAQFSVICQVNGACRAIPVKGGRN